MKNANQKRVGELIESLEPEDFEKLKVLGTQLLNEMTEDDPLIKRVASTLVVAWLLLLLYGEDDVLKRSDVCEMVKEQSTDEQREV